MDREAELREIGAELADSQLDAQQILDQVTAAVSKARGTTVVALLMGRDPSTARVAVADSADPATVEFIRRFVALMEDGGSIPTTGVSERVIQSGQAVFLNRIGYAEFMANLTREGQEVYSRLGPPEQVREGTFGLLIVPMRARGATIGTLGLLDLRGRGVLSEEDEPWLRAVADRTGLAVENAQLSHLALERQEWLNAVRSVAGAVSDGQELAGVLELILKHAAGRLGVDAADVLLSGADGTMVVAAATGFSVTTAPGYPLTVGDSVRRSLEQHPHEPLADLPEIGRTQRQPLIAREGFRSYLGLPIVANRRLVGVLELFQRSERAWLGETLDLLRLLVDLAGVAVGAARTEARPLPASGARAERDLTPMERQVLSGMADGLTNHEIASRLDLADSTVKFHVGQILRKVGAANRAQAVRRATQEGWFE